MSSLYEPSFYAFSGIDLADCDPERLCSELMTDSSIATSESTRSLPLDSSPDTPLPTAGAIRRPVTTLLSCINWPPSPSSLNSGQSQSCNLSMGFDLKEEATSLLSLHRSTALILEGWPDQKSEVHKSPISSVQDKNFFLYQDVASFGNVPSQEALEMKVQDFRQSESCVNHHPTGRSMFRDDRTSDISESPSSRGQPSYLEHDFLPSHMSYWHAGPSIGEDSLAPETMQVDLKATGVPLIHEPDICSNRSPNFLPCPTSSSVPIQHVGMVSPRQAESISPQHIGKKSQTGPKRVRRPRRSRDKMPVVHLRGTHQCQFVDEFGNRCRSTFQRQEHFQRHSRTHLPAYPFRCQLSEFIGDHNCGRRMKRSDNRDQHHFTHGKGGLDENVSSGRNVHVEPEVLIQALKKTSFCDDDECNANGPCKNTEHLAQVEKKQPSRIRSQMKRLTRGCTEQGYKRRVTKRIANIHVEHDQMKRLGFPQCLDELERLQFSVDAPSGARRYFQYAKNWHRDENGGLKNWRFDNNGCLFVRDIDENGSEHERCLCGPLHKIQHGPEPDMDAHNAVAVRSRL